MYYLNFPRHTVDGLLLAVFYYGFCTQYNAHSSATWVKRGWLSARAECCSFVTPNYWLTGLCMCFCVSLFFTRLLACNSLIAI